MAPERPVAAMTQTPPHETTDGGRLATNIMHFARVLRAAGLPVGTGGAIAAVRAVETAGIGRHDDL